MSVAPLILCVDDQREVRNTILRDLEPLTDHFTVIGCTSAAAAWAELEHAADTGQAIALVVCDHMMPVETGVQLLTRMHADDRFRAVHSILLTGMAPHEDAIEATNTAHVDRYLPKPWDPVRLRRIVQEELTRWVLDSGLPATRFGRSLAGDIIMRESWRDEANPRA